MVPLISVITCAHNPKLKYLQQVLEALKCQTLDSNLWEYLLIDNGSREALENRIDLSWQPHARHIHEERLGLTMARLRGIEDAKGEILVFVDDDNVLDSDFLEQVLHVSRQWAFIGAWSGQTRPGFDVPPPAWTSRYWGNLVIREFEDDIWSNLPHLPETMPCGAGMCVRREVAEHYAHLHSSGRRPVMLDRTGKSLLSGGDNDLAACACDLGHGMGLFAALKLTHLIPPQRLEEDYLVRLAEGISYSTVILHSYRSSTSTPPPVMWSSKVANIVRIAVMGRRRRRFHQAVQRGEREATLYLLQNSTH